MPDVDMHQHKPWNAARGNNQQSASDRARNYSRWLFDLCHFMHCFLSCLVD
jgi:hypothetical protein